MWTETSGIIGVGYEGREISSFIHHLQPWKVDVLVDVRLSAISRKKGFSKTALSSALAEAGIRYEHLPVLGNPKENRDGFWAPGTNAAMLAHEKYRELMLADSARAAIHYLAQLAAAEHVALLCFEASEACCHRRLVLEAVWAEAAALSRT
ncbi:DUF488 domain-containing protein [Arthrobacter sp. FB24]|uniref:DUF488 domain-containing protein n=1 Tax=Arthrobacter sp. (strain FB24) TaxID=290399 RepID=UPI0005BBC882|nr:DUF488 domain-containing protein [Arthrobacter sp. FB24]